MTTKPAAAIIVSVLCAPLVANAVPIADFPGLEPLIDRADAIVVLRIDRHLSDFGSPTFYSTHECFIYQAIKGDIPPLSRITLQLMDPETDFATPYAHGSNHLVFLMRKMTENEPTEYRSLAYKGARVLLPPLGREKEPKGDTVKEKVRTLIEESIHYQAEELEKRQRFLRMMLGQREHDGRDGTAAPETQPARETHQQRPKVSPDPMLLSLKTRLERELRELEPKPTFEFPDGHAGRGLVVRFRTRNYIIHPSNKAGRVEERTITREGPSDEGFLLNVYSQRLGAVNQAVTPQLVREPYWNLYLNVYPVERDRKQLYFCLSYRGWTDEALIEKIKKVTEKWSLTTHENADGQR